MKKKICKCCSIEFVPIKNKQEYCSRGCSHCNKVEQEVRTCELEECENVFCVYPNTKIKKRFCSRKCQVEWQKTSQLGEKNGNFGNRKPNMFKHTEEAKRIIREKVTKSWESVERLEKQIEGINKHRLPNGSLDWITPESRENVSKKNIERLIFIIFHNYCKIAYLILNH